MIACTHSLQFAAGRNCLMTCDDCYITVSCRDALFQYNLNNLLQNVGANL